MTSNKQALRSAIRRHNQTIKEYTSAIFKLGYEYPLTVRLLTHELQVVKMDLTILKKQCEEMGWQHED